MTDIFCFGEEIDWVWENKDVSRWLLWLFTLSCSSLGANCYGMGACCTLSRWCIWYCNIEIELLKTWLQKLVTVSKLPEVKKIRRFSKQKCCCALECTDRMACQWTKHLRGCIQYDEIHPPGLQHVTPFPCPLCSQFWMICERFDRIAIKRSSAFCGDTCASEETSLCPQLAGRKKSWWQLDTRATWLKAFSSFHMSAISSHAVEGLTSEFRASSSSRVLGFAPEERPPSYYPAE